MSIQTTWINLEREKNNLSKNNNVMDEIQQTQIIYLHKIHEKQYPA